MDRKSILVLSASFAVLFLWFWIVPKIYPPIQRPLNTNVVATATNAASPGSATNPPLAPPPMLTAVPTNLSAPLVPPDAPEQIEKLETADAVYTFTSHGGALKLVQLKKYLETVGGFGSKGAASREMVTLNTRALAPVLALRGSEAITGDGLFQLTKVSSNSLRAEKVLPGGLAITKEFTLGSDYLLTARVRMENRAAQPLPLPERSWTAGTASSISPQDDATLLGVVWFNGEKAMPVDPPWFQNSGFGGCVGGGPPRLEHLAGASNVVWTAVHDQFFTLAVLPASNHVASQVLVRRVDLPPLRQSYGKPQPPYGYEAGLIYPPTTLAPGQKLDVEFTLYAGPKEYKTLSRLGHNLDVVMGYTGFFGWFAKALLLSMNGLYAFVPNYGVVIILITVIIKLLFWPLTQASTKSMKRMQQLQPEMKALQAKYKDDPAKMNKKLMEFMKENKVSPLGGCLPMLLQIPVFFGFYQMIRSAIELRGAHFLWVADLSRPDTIFVIPGLDWIPFFGLQGLGLPINPLPLLMGVTMLYQARMTPPSPGMDPAQQKIMKYMPVMFMVFLYNFSAGLALYWTVQNLLTIAQMKLTKAKSGPDGPAHAATSTALPPKKKRHS